MSRFTFGFLGGGGTGGGGGLTSVGLSMPSAFNVTNSPLITNGVLNVLGAGNSNQYIDGTGALQTFPTNVGGGSAVVYYLNGSVNQGVIGGNTYYQMSDTAVFVPNADFNINADGYIAQFITDSNVPQLPFVPGGAWQFQLYFSASSGGGNPQFYIELYKYDGTTFTLIGSNSAAPESITGGTSIDLYTTLVACPQTPLNLTDRIAIRVYVIHSSRTITLHTQDVHICKVTTTFTYGLVSLNGLTDSVQYLQVGTSGTDFNITQSGLDTHVFNLPDASATSRGALTSADWTTFNNKQNAITQGNLTETTSNVLTIFGGTGAVIGLGTTIQVQQSSALQDGYLSSTDWNTFNNKANNNIYDADGTLTAIRTVNIADKELYFTGNNAASLIGFNINDGTNVVDFQALNNLLNGNVTNIPANINAIYSHTANGWNYTANNPTPTDYLNLDFNANSFTLNKRVGVINTYFELNINGVYINNNYYLPLTDGTNGQVISTNGAGTLSFVTPFSLPSLTSGSVLFSDGTTIAQDNANFYWDDINNRLGIGTNAPTERLTVSGNIQANLLVGGGYVKIYDDATFNYIESNKPTVLTSTSNNAIRITAGGSFSVQTDGSSLNKLVISTSNSAGNTTTQFTSTLFGQSGCLASTEVISVLFSGNTKTWQNGNIATQRWFHITSNTAAFASAASTITNSYGLYVEAATAGANATITNNYALGVKGQIGFDWTVAGNPTMRIGDWSSPTPFSTYGWGIVTSNGLFRVPNTLYFGDTNFVIRKATLNGVIEPFNNLTLQSINTTGGQKTYLFGEQSTGNVSIGSTTATERLTVSGGNILLEDGGNFIVGTTTGTKIGTATNQKLGFYNATPIVQPTAVTSPQGIANALTNLGLLASSTIVTAVWNVTTQAGASYSASNSDYVLINAATQTVTLPAASANARVGVKMINATVTDIQVRTASIGVTIDGIDRSSIGLGLYNQYDAYVFLSDGTNWWIES